MMFHREMESDDEWSVWSSPGTAWERIEFQLSTATEAYKVTSNCIVNE